MEHQKQPPTAGPEYAGAITLRSDLSISSGIEEGGPWHSLAIILVDGLLLSCHLSSHPSIALHLPEGSADNLALYFTKKIEAIGKALQQIPTLSGHIPASAPIDSALFPVTVVVPHRKTLMTSENMKKHAHPLTWQFLLKRNSTFVQDNRQGSW